MKRALLILLALCFAFSAQAAEVKFKNASVHDPSVLLDNGTLLVTRANDQKTASASGATVTIDVHSRASWSGKVVDWGAGNAPEAVRFKLDEQSKSMGRALMVRYDGLYACSGVIMIVR